MDDRQFEVETTDHPSGAVLGRCIACGTERTSSAADVLAWKQHHKCPETVAKTVYASGEPVERPGDQEAAMDEVAPQQARFGDLERRVLIFEDEWARTHPTTGHANTGPKLTAIVEAFPELTSTTRYYQVLNSLLDAAEAEEFRPVLIRRLRNRRDEARRARQAATARAQEIDAQIKGAPSEEERVSTSRVERCEMLAKVLKRAGCDRAAVSLSGTDGDTSIVVVRTGADGEGYYRLVPGVGEAVTIYYVPPQGTVRDLGHALSHARAAGVVLDHLAGVHS